MKYALVTGASSGIGLRYAEMLAAKGYGIVVVSNMEEKNREVASSLREKYGVEAEPVYMDLTAANAASELHDMCRNKGFEIEVLVSNAGMLQFGRLMFCPEEKTQRIIDLHCMFPAQACRLFGGDMARRGKGYILLMSSMASWIPYPTIALYSATKAFLKNLGDALRYEFGSFGVKVTTVYPGAVDTPLYDLSESKRKWLRRLGIMSGPETVARKGLRALFRNRRRCIPGLMTKIEVGVCAVLPYSFLKLVIAIPAVRRILEKN